MEKYLGHSLKLLGIV